MKNIVNIIALLATVLLLSGCGDLLDTSPYNKIDANNMWSSEELADKGVAGIYSTMLVSPIGTRVWWHDDFSLATQKRDPQSVGQGTLKTNDGTFSWRWTSSYNMIHRANDAIQNLHKASLSTEKENRLVCESKFLRAYGYYCLNEAFRGVPVYLEPVEVEDATNARETESFVWNVIIDDLTDCINNSHFPDRYQKGNANFGRATKAAAYALRGKVYMWTKEYSKAEADFRKVAELGHALFQTTDYKSIFKEANEQSEEMIFSAQCISEPGMGADIQLYAGSRCVFHSGWNHFLGAPDFIESYECADGKPFNWNDFIPNYNSMTPIQRKVFFLRDGLTADEKSKFAAEGVAMQHYLDNGNEARIRKAYEDRDPRLMANFITPYSTFHGTRDHVKTYDYTLRWPFRSVDNPTLDLMTDTNTKFYYLYRKFIAEGIDEILDENYTPTDIPLIRYADVLLLLAEAINEQGFNPEAIDIVNMVRDRAGCALLQNSDPTKATYVSGQINLRERIRNERRWEFPMEGINFYDELRWGTWKDTKFKSGNGDKQIWGELEGLPYMWPGNYYNVMPIPKSEIEMNKKIIQNEGWVD